MTSLLTSVTFDKFSLLGFTCRDQVFTIASDLQVFFLSVLFIAV